VAVGVACPFGSKLARTVKLLVAVLLGVRCEIFKGVEDMGVAAAAGATGEGKARGELVARLEDNI
jgi:hypothetical protein